MPYEENKEGELSYNKNINNNMEMKRKFSVKAETKCTLLCLKLEDLNHIELKFPEIYDEIFESSLQRYKYVVEEKNKAFKDIR